MITALGDERREESVVDKKRLELVRDVYRNQDVDLFTTHISLMKVIGLFVVS